MFPHRRPEMIARTLALALALLALGGCAAFEGVYSLMGNRCVADARERVEQTDWSKAHVVSLRIRQDEFTPMVIRLRLDQPYVIRITNGDDHSHVFRASEFFENVALARVDVAGNDEARSCISAVVVGGGQTADVLFVTVRDGRYVFADNRVLFSIVDFGNPMGVIHVE